MMLKSPKIRQAVLETRSSKVQTSKKKTIIWFSSNVSVKRENNVIRDVIADHFITNSLPDLRYLRHLTCQTFHAVTETYGGYIYKIFVVVVATKLKQKELN